MASDYDEAKEHIKDFFKEQEDIINHTGTVIRDAIANFDAVSEIPEESSGWNWDIVLNVLKGTFNLAVATVPQLRGLVLVYEATVADTKPAIEWVEKTTKRAKDFGLDPSKLIKKDAPKPPSVKDLKTTAVKAREGVQWWNLKTIEFIKNIKTYYVDEYLPMMATQPKTSGRLKQTMLETLGPVPKFEAEPIKQVGVNFELNLYRRVYAKGVTIYITSPNRGRSEEQVRGLPGPILERVKALTMAPSDAQAIAGWDVKRVTEACNSCHSRPRMDPPTKPGLGSVNTDWLIKSKGAGRLKDFNDPRGVTDFTDWYLQTSK